MIDKKSVRRQDKDKQGQDKYDGEDSGQTITEDTIRATDNKDTEDSEVDVPYIMVRDEKVRTEVESEHDIVTAEEMGDHEDIIDHVRKGFCPLMADHPKEQKF